MNNLSHKVAVASVCMALGFVLGANTEVKAATLSLEPTTIFTVNDLDSRYAVGGPFSFDGLGDYVRPGKFDFVIKGLAGEVASFAEFNIGNFSLASNTVISSAVFQARIAFKSVFGYGIEGTPPSSVGIFGYVGNGTPDPSDLEAGVLLSSVDISSPSFGNTLNFNVTPFLNQRVSNGNTFAGFGIRALNVGGLGLSQEFPPPRLIVETAEPVPEPTTIFGSALALGVGGWLKRRKSGQENKTTSH